MTTTQTTPISVQDKVRNYQGQNRFLLNMKDSLKKWGRLTPNQEAATEKALNSEVKTIDTENLPEDIKRIVDYKGENPFVKDIASKFTKWGTLTSKQISAAVAQIQKEEDKEKTVRMNWPTIGETLKIGRKKGMELKEQYGLKFNPILILDSQNSNQEVGWCDRFDCWDNLKANPSLVEGFFVMWWCLYLNHLLIQKL